MLHGQKRIEMLGAALLAVWIGGAPPASAQADPDAVAGEVASVFGNVTAARPGQPPRQLGCGDKVYAGERVVTAPDSRVGILSGEFLVQLDPDSTLRVDRTADGTPALELEEGRVRSVDPRLDGAPGLLRVLDTQGTLLSGDTEGYVFREKVGRYAMLCEWDAPLEVSRPDGRITAQPRECVLSKPREPLYKSPAHEERIALAAPDACPPGPIVGAAPIHFTPTDVAAGPPSVFSPPLPDAPVPIDRSPCDDPGSGCTAFPTGGPPPPGPGAPPVVEQPGVNVPPF